jgi:hypothetical protein
MVLLTMPPEPNSSNIPLQLRHLQAYKNAFLAPSILTHFATLLGEPVAKEGSERSEDDNVFIELVLTLVRNLLQISDPPEDKNVSNSHRVHMHERLLVLLYESHILELLIVIVQQLGENCGMKTWNVLILELVYLVFRKEKPGLLLDAEEVERNPTRAAASVTAILQNERKAMRASLNARHSRFGGTYDVRHNSGGNSRQLHSKPIADLEFNERVAIARPRGGRRPRLDVMLTATSSDTRVILKRFADEFLETCYNSMVLAIRSDLASESAAEKILPIDKENFVWCIRFFTEFHRHSQLRAVHAQKLAGSKLLDVSPSLVAATMDETLFRYVALQTEILRAEKSWNALSTTVSCLRELVSLLRLTTKSSNQADRVVAKNLIHKLFYDPNLLLRRAPSLIRTWHPARNTRQDLVSLVELSYELWGIVKRFQKNRETLYVRSKRAKAKPALPSTEPGAPEPAEPAAPQVEEGDANEHETQLNYNIALHSLMNKKILRNMCFLLQGYASNPPALNERIVKLFSVLFERHTCMFKFFQLAFLRLFDCVLSDKNARQRADLKKIVEFAELVIEKYFQVAEKYPLIFCESLFWLSKADSSFIFSVAFPDQERPRPERVQVRTESLFGRDSSESEQELSNASNHSAEAQKQASESESEEPIERRSSNPAVLRQRSRLEDVIARSSTRRRQTLGGLEALDRRNAQQQKKFQNWTDTSVLIAEQQEQQKRRIRRLSGLDDDQELELELEPAEHNTKRQRIDDE